MDDIAPGHTGKGANFRHADMAHADYPGIYHTVSISAEAWSLSLSPNGRDSVNLSAEAEARLEHARYIIGRLQRVSFYEGGANETNRAHLDPWRELMA